MSLDNSNKNNLAVGLTLPEQRPNNFRLEFNIRGFSAILEGCRSKGDCVVTDTVFCYGNKSVRNSTKCDSGTGFVIESLLGYLVKILESKTLEDEVLLSKILSGLQTFVQDSRNEDSLFRQAKLLVMLIYHELAPQHKVAFKTHMLDECTRFAPSLLDYIEGTNRLHYLIWCGNNKRYRSNVRTLCLVCLKHCVRFSKAAHSNCLFTELQKNAFEKTLYNIYHNREPPELTKNEIFILDAEDSDVLKWLIKRFEVLVPEITRFFIVDQVRSYTAGQAFKNEAAKVIKHIDTPADSNNNMSTQNTTFDNISGIREMETPSVADLPDLTECSSIVPSNTRKLVTSIDIKTNTMATALWNDVVIIGSKSVNNSSSNNNIINSIDNTNNSDLLTETNNGSVNKPRYANISEKDNTYSIANIATVEKALLNRKPINIRTDMDNKDEVQANSQESQSVKVLPHMISLVDKYNNLELRNNQEMAVVMVSPCNNRSTIKHQNTLTTHYCPQDKRPSVLSSSYSFFNSAGNIINNHITNNLNEEQHTKHDESDQIQMSVPMYNASIMSVQNNNNINVNNKD